MISVEASSRLGFRPKGALVLAAQARGIGFELLYAPAIRGASRWRAVLRALARLTPSLPAAQTAAPSATLWPIWPR